MFHWNHISICVIIYTDIISHLDTHTHHTHHTHSQSAKQTTHAITFAPDSQLKNKNVEMEIDSYNVQLFDFYLLTITIIVVLEQRVNEDEKFWLFEKK